MLLATLPWLARCVVGVRSVAVHYEWIRPPLEARLLNARRSASTSVAASTCDGVSLKFGALHLESPEDDREARSLLDGATALIREALPVADAEWERFALCMQRSIEKEKQKLNRTQLTLQAVLEQPVEEQACAARQARTQQLQKRLASCNDSISRLNTELDDASLLISDARVFVAHTIECRHASLVLQFTLQQLAHLCTALLKMDDKLQGFNISQRHWLRGWLIRVDELFTVLCSLVPRLRTLQRQRGLQAIALEAGALHLLPMLLRTQVAERTFAIEGLWFNRCCRRPDEHDVCHQPYLRLFVFGLDPTMPHKGKRSAIQIAREFVRDHPWRAVGSDNSVEAAVKEESDSIPSMLFARAHRPREVWSEAEEERRKFLHSQFLRALIPAWLAHSTKVRSLLLEAAPTRLVPPLVDMVSRYLDLEGVPPEPVAAAEDGCSMATL